LRKQPSAHFFHYRPNPLRSLFNPLDLMSYLRRFEALPLRTYRDGDFREADRILGVLGGFGRVPKGACPEGAEGACPEPAEGERLLSQLLLRPAPDDWADAFQSLTRPLDMRAHASRQACQLLGKAV